MTWWLINQFTAFFAKQMVEGRKDINKKIAMKVEIPNSKTEAVI